MGLSGHGLKFAPVLGEILAEMSTESQVSYDIDFLRLSRGFASTYSETTIRTLRLKFSNLNGLSSCKRISASFFLLLNSEGPRQGVLHRHKYCPDIRVSYIYVLSNPAMPGLLKIGLTAHKVSKRATELYTTGVPAEFVVEGAWHVPRQSLSVTEAEIHRLLGEHRYNHSREFFVLEREEALLFIRSYMRTRRGFPGSLFPLVIAWRISAMAIAVFVALDWLTR